MIYYINQRTLETTRTKYKLTFLEGKFLECFKYNNLVEYRDLAINMYGNDLDISQDSLKEIKSRLSRKCGLEFAPRYKKGYRLINKIEFIEE